MLEEAIEAARACDRRAALADALHTLSLVEWDAGRRERANRVACEARAVAASSHDLVMSARHQVEWAVSFAVDGWIDEAHAAATAANRVGIEDGLPVPQRRIVEAVERLAAVRLMVRVAGRISRHHCP